MIKGISTAEGTARFASRFPAHRQNGFFREIWQQRLASSVGIGSYLGAPNEETDRGYEASIDAAVKGGINFIDTSLNYRNQRSERNIGAALGRLIESGAAQRDELIVCTKAGFVMPDALPGEELSAADKAAGHSMAPAFLADQLERSRANLGLETIDVFYLHNPETQLRHGGEEEFYHRVEAAFVAMEKFCDEGKIAYYGIATWDGLRKPGQLALERFVQIALDAGGPLHHFRFAQMPLNLAMTEVFSQPTQKLSGQPGSALSVAGRVGVTTVGSASMMQSRLTSGLPEHVKEKLGLTTDAQRAIQFSRSTPGMSISLAGMSNPQHVSENLGLAAVPAASAENYFRIYQQ